MIDVAHLDDLTALRRYARDRDPRAFEVLVRRYQSLVYGTCQRQLRNSSDAEDATQETFVKLARKAGAIRTGLAGWLHSCAVGTSRDLIRRNSTRRKHEKAASGDLGVLESPRSDELTWAEVGPEVDAAMEALSTADRSLLVSRFLTGVPQTQLAEDAGVSPSAIHQRIDRAVGRLRKTLNKRGFAVTAGAFATVLAQAGAEASVVPAVVTGSLVKVGLAGVGAGQATAGGVGGGAVVTKLTAAFSGLGVAGKAAVVATAVAAGAGAVGVGVELMDGEQAASAATAAPTWVESPAIGYAGEPTAQWLEGTWKLVEAYSNEMPPEFLTVEGDTIRCAVPNFMRFGEEFELVFRLIDNDAEATPAVVTLDVLRCTYPEPNLWNQLVGKRIEAIYQIQDGLLKVQGYADGVGRPDDFDVQDKPLLGWHGFMDPNIDQSAFTVDPGFEPALAGKWRWGPERYISFEDGRMNVYTPFFDDMFQEGEIIGFVPQDDPDGRFVLDTVITSTDVPMLLGKKFPMLMRFDGPDTVWVTHFEGEGFFQGRIPDDFIVNYQPNHVAGRLIRHR